MDMDLRQLSKDGKVWFTIRDNDTPENVAVHEAFKEFCKHEANNNYTLGLKILLKYMQDDYKYEFLADKIVAVDDKVEELKNKLTPKLDKKEKEDLF